MFGWSSHLWQVAPERDEALEKPGSDDDNADYDTSNLGFDHVLSQAEMANKTLSKGHE
jgi:hypothetical protein